MSISISNPSSTEPISTVDVTPSAMPSTPQTGTVNVCKGDVLPPAGFIFDGVFLRMARGTTSFTAAQVVATPDIYLSKQALYGNNPTTVKANWDMSGDTRMQAECDSSPNERINRLYAVSRSYLYNPSNPTNPYQESLEQVSVQFKGRKVASGGGSSMNVAILNAPSPVQAKPVPEKAGSGKTAGVKGAAKGALEMVASLEAAPAAGLPAILEPAPIPTNIVHPARPGRRPGVDVGPDNCVDGWLLYGGLSVTNPDLGNRLFRQGEPLRARILAIAVARVDWSICLPVAQAGHRVVRRAIRRPAGDFTVEHCQPSPWLFPNSPTHSIVAYQNLLGVPEQVLLSTSRETPDILQFENDHDILIQVNCLSFMQSTAAGSFDLWVKVID